MHPVLLVAAGVVAIVGTGAAVVVHKAKNDTPEKGKKGGKGPGGHQVPKSKPVAKPSAPILVDRARLASDPEYKSWYDARQAGEQVGPPPADPYAMNVPPLRNAPAAKPTLRPSNAANAPPFSFTITDLPVDVPPPRPVYNQPPSLIQRSSASDIVMPEMTITATAPASLAPRAYDPVRDGPGF